MGMDAARAKFREEIERAQAAGQGIRPLPMPVQRLASTGSRHARFSQQSIESALSGEHRHNNQAPSPLAPALARDVTTHAATRAAPVAPRQVSETRLSVRSPLAPMQSPYLAVDPQRTDYFQTTTRQIHSWRAMTHLALVVAGRVMITFGTGGLIQGFAPRRPLGPGLGPPPALPAPDGGLVVHHVALGVALTTLGTLCAATGIALFVRDTYQLGPRRALVIGSISYTGLTCILGASILYVYGQAQDNLLDRYMSLLPRGFGNFCFFYAVTNSFPSSEIVHGNVPLPNREQTRLITFATGGASMVIWAYLGTSSQNAPIWARELTKAIGISGLHIGASLSRTDAMRMQSEVRAITSPSNIELEDVSDVV